MGRPKEKGSTRLPFSASFWVDSEIVTSWSPSEAGTFSVSFAERAASAVSEAAPGTGGAGHGFLLLTEAGLGGAIDC